MGRAYDGRGVSDLGVPLLGVAEAGRNFAWIALPRAVVEAGVVTSDALGVPLAAGVGLCAGADMGRPRDEGWLTGVACVPACDEDVAVSCRVKLVPMGRGTLITGFA